MVCLNFCLILPIIEYFYTQHCIGYGLHDVLNGLKNLFNKSLVIVEYQLFNVHCCCCPIIRQIVYSKIVCSINDVIHLVTDP